MQSSLHEVCISTDNMHSTRLRNRVRRVTDAARWSFCTFNREAFDCFEYDAEYTEKYIGISDVNYDSNIRFRSVVDIVQRKKIRKKRLSQYKI